MNYTKWADEYKKDAERVLGIVDKYKEKLKSENLSKDERGSIQRVITAYRCIYRELLKTAKHLRQRGENDCEK